jgi:hypothetical protein
LRGFLGRLFTSKTRPADGEHSLPLVSANQAKGGNRGDRRL